MQCNCLCQANLPCQVLGRQASVTHRLRSLASLREATRSAARFDVAAEPPPGLWAVDSVDNAEHLLQRKKRARLSAGPFRRSLDYLPAFLGGGLCSLTVVAGCRFA